MALAPRAHRLLKQAALDLNLFYDIRDQILGPKSAGRAYIDLYYTHNREILDLLVGDPDLQAKGVEVLELWQPNLQALLDGQGDTAIITAEDVQAADDFLADLSVAGSPALQQTIADERTRLGNLDNFIGLTMEEARGLVIGHAVYLPAILRGGTNE